jgi:hypothetical protein
VDAGQNAGLVKVQLVGGLPVAGPDVLLKDIGFTASTDSFDGRKYLLPNTYIAVLDGNPFIENALGVTASAKRARSSAIVFGVLDPADTQ